MESHAKTGGILGIISGVFGILTGIALIFLGVFMKYIMGAALTGQPGFSSSQEADMVVNLMIWIYAGMGVCYALFSVLAVVGGIFALKKTHWGWVLAGAVVGALAFFPTGIASVIFVTLAKPIFGAQQPATIPVNPVTNQTM